MRATRRGAAAVGALVAGLVMVVAAPTAPPATAVAPVQTITFLGERLSDDGTAVVGLAVLANNQLGFGRYDRISGTQSAGATSAGGFGAPWSISADGRYLAANAMVRYDLVTGSSTGMPADLSHPATALDISGDGSVLVGSDDQGGVLVWRVGDAAGRRLAASLPHTGPRAVVVTATLDGPGATAVVWLTNPQGCTIAGCSELWAVDTATDRAYVLGVGVRGEVADGTVQPPRLSRDGRFLAFVSDASNLVAGISTRRSRAYLSDLQAGTIRLLVEADSVDWLSNDGRRVVVTDNTGQSVPTPHTLLVDTVTGDVSDLPVAAVMSHDGSTLMQRLGNQELFSTTSSAFPVLDHLATAAVPVPTTPPRHVPRPAQWPVARDIGPQGPTTQDGYDSVAALSDDGSRAAAGSSLLGGAVVDVATGVPHTNIAAGSMSGDGRYAGASGFVIDMADAATLTPAFPAGTSGRISAFSTHGDVTVGTATGAGRTDVVAGPPAGPLVSLTDGLLAGAVQRAVVSADGRWVVLSHQPAGGPCTPVASSCESRLYRVDRSNGRIDELTTGADGRADVWPVISGDGRYVAWLSAPVEAGITASYTDITRYDLVVLDTTTGERRTVRRDVIVRRAEGAAPLAVSLDGSRIAVELELGGYSIHVATIAVVDPATGRARHVAFDADGLVAAATRPVLSGDGRTVAFLSQNPRMSAGRLQYGAVRGTYAYVADIADLSAIDPPAAELTSTVPVRLVDTRDGVGGLRLGAGESLVVPVAGVGGVPVDVGAVVVNVTAVGASGSGFLTVYPCGSEVPTASNVNYVVGQVVANLVTAKVGAGGAVCVFSHVSTDVVIDLAGWFPGG